MDAAGCGMLASAGRTATQCGGALSAASLSRGAGKLDAIPFAEVAHHRLADRLITGTESALPLGLRFGHHKGVKLVVGQAEGKRVARLTRCFSSHDAAVYSKVRRHWKHLNEGRSLDPVSEASTRTHGPVLFANYPVHTGSWDGDGARKRMRAARRPMALATGIRSTAPSMRAVCVRRGRRRKAQRLQTAASRRHRWQVGDRAAWCRSRDRSGRWRTRRRRHPGGRSPAVKTHLGKESQHALDRPAPWDRTELADETPADLTLLDGEPSAIPLPRVGGNPPTRLLAFKWGREPHDQENAVPNARGCAAGKGSFRQARCPACL